MGLCVICACGVHECAGVCVCAYVSYVHVVCLWCVCACVHMCCACGVLVVCACVHKQVPSLHTNCSLSFETVSLTESGGHQLARLAGQVAEHSPLLPPSTVIPGKHSLGQSFMQC